MRRRVPVLIACVLVLNLVFAGPALAVKPADAVKAEKIDWFTVASGSSDYVTAVQVPGHVNLNTPDGAVTMILNGVITLQPNTTYTVWIRQFGGYTGDYINSYTPLGYYALGSFTTDEWGYGEFHYNIASSELTPGTRNIQVAINYGTVPGGSYGYTVAATTKYTQITNE